MSHREINIYVDDEKNVLTIKQGITGSIKFPYKRVELDYPVGNGLREQKVFVVHDTNLLREDADGSDS